jgi:iron(III) transport system permease protein
LPAYRVAAATGVLIICVTALPMILYQRLLSQSYKYAIVGGKGYRPRSVELSLRIKVTIWLFLALYFVFAQLLPLLNTVWVSLQPYMQPISIAGLADISFSSYNALSWPLLMLGFRNTGFLMLAAPTLAVFFGLFIAWTVVRSKLSWRGIYDYFAFLPHMVPSVVFGLSMLLMTLFIVPALGLYGTIYAILIVYVVLHISFATRTFNTILLAINLELDEVASAHGIGPWRRLLTIILPLMLPTIASTWLWLALLSYRELTIASFLATRENITLSAVIWSSWTSGGTSLSATMTVIGLAIMGPMIVLYWWMNHRFVAGRIGEG